MSLRKARYDLIYKQMLVADQELKTAYIQEKVWASVLFLLQNEVSKIEKKRRAKSNGRKKT